MDLLTQTSKIRKIQDKEKEGVRKPVLGFRGPLIKKLNHLVRPSKKCSLRSITLTTDVHSHGSTYTASVIIWVFEITTRTKYLSRTVNEIGFGKY